MSEILASCGCKISEEGEDDEYVQIIILWNKHGEKTQNVYTLYEKKWYRYLPPVVAKVLMK